MLKKGDMAPVFELLNQDGNTIRLEDFRGKTVVLYFYPKDNTPGCTNQACGFRDINRELEEMNVKLLGVSRDGQNAHSKFIEKYGLNFDLLSDPEKIVHEAYGVWQEKTTYGKKVMGTVRSTFVIDEKGYIKEIFNKVKAKENPFEVLDYIKKSDE